jgi:hypothetical protein
MNSNAANYDPAATTPGTGGPNNDGCFNPEVSIQLASCNNGVGTCIAAHYQYDPMLVFLTAFQTPDDSAALVRWSELKTAFDLLGDTSLDDNGTTDFFTNDVIEQIDVSGNVIGATFQNFRFYGPGSTEGQAITENTGDAATDWGIVHYLPQANGVTAGAASYQWSSTEKLIIKSI